MQPIFRDHDVRYYQNRGRSESGVFCILASSENLRLGIEYKVAKSQTFHYHHGSRTTTSLQEALGALYLLHRVARAEEISFKTSSLQESVHFSFPFSARLVYNHALDAAHSTLSISDRFSTETSTARTYFSLLLPRNRPIDDVLREIIVPSSSLRYLHDYCLALGSMTTMVASQDEVKAFLTQYKEGMLARVLQSLPEDVRERLDRLQQGSGEEDVELLPDEEELELLPDPVTDLDVQQSYTHLKKGIQSLISEITQEVGVQADLHAFNHAFSYLDPRFLKEFNNGVSQEIRGGLQRLADLCSEVTVYSPRFKEYGTQVHDFA